jgi:hypothetical protein
MIHVSATDCRALDQTVDVDPSAGATLDGALPSDRFVLFRGPEGSPGWYRAGLAVWLPGGSMYGSPPETYKADFGAMTGVAVDAGLVDRWFAAHVNAGYAGGAFRRKTFGTNFALPDSAKASWERLELRAGPRFPFNAAALGLGLSFGVQEVDVEGVLKGVPTGVGGAFAELDVQPLCDWGVFGLFQVQAATWHNGDPEIGLQIGAFYEPNPRCQRARGAPSGLRATAR